MNIEQRLNRAWYGRPGPLWGLLPLEYLYRGATALRRHLVRRERSADAPPVIVVGNITVGGTGKTPVVIALAQWLQREGFRPGIVSRGYGGRAAGYPCEVTADTPADIAGDEACLMARRTGLPVVVSPRRREAVAQLAAHYRCDVVVSDDGLQHYAMARDMEVVVIDGGRGLGNGHCLPVGPLREPASRLRQVDVILVNGEAAAPLPDGALPMRLRAGDLVALHGGERRAVPQWRASKRVHAVAGIGHPQRFFATLAGLGFEVVAHPYPDHHRFSAADLTFSDELPVIMTEKDAVKCREFARPDWWALRVDAELPAAFYTRLGESLSRVAKTR